MGAGSGHEGHIAACQLLDPHRYYPGQESTGGHRVAFGWQLRLASPHQKGRRGNLTKGFLPELLPDPWVGTIGRPRYQGFKGGPAMWADGHACLLIFHSEQRRDDIREESAGRGYFGRGGGMLLWVGHFGVGSLMGGLETGIRGGRTRRSHSPSGADYRVQRSGSGGVSTGKSSGGEGVGRREV